MREAPKQCEAKRPSDESRQSTIFTGMALSTSLRDASIVEHAESLPPSNQPRPADPAVEPLGVFEEDKEFVPVAHEVAATFGARDVAIAVAEFSLELSVSLGVLLSPLLGSLSVPEGCDDHDCPDDPPDERNEQEDDHTPEEELTAEALGFLVLVPHTEGVLSPLLNLDRGRTLRSDQGRKNPDRDVPVLIGWSAPER